MTALNRKLRRDLMTMKGQSLAICLVMACGVATFVMSLATLHSLHYSREIYYRQYRFADLFAQVKRAPEALSAEIASIPGVAQVQTRVVADVTLDMPDMLEPATGRLISVPELGRPVLNNLHLRRGRWIEPGRPGEAMVSEAFADAHALQPGHRIRAVINGRLQELQIVGIVLSPEYVLSLSGAADLPDDRRFGVFWMGREELAAALDMDGAFNDVTVSLRRDASAPAVIERLDLLLDRYGSIGAYDRADQLSDRFLSDELRGLRGMGMVVPVIFLAVAAFLLNVVMSRLIGTQREQIAALKAFGYGNMQVGWHYLKFVLVISVVGSAIGVVVGAWLGEGLMTLYERFYRFPVMEFTLHPPVLLGGLAIAIGAATLGTLGSVRRAVILPAAQAMRPETPANYRPTVVERVGLQRLFTQPARMVLRHLERRPVKAGLSILGIAMAVAILVMGRFMTDAFNHMMELGFFIQQRQDVTVTFVEPSSAATLFALQRLPGVLDVQPMRAVPVRLVSGHLEYRTALTGVAADGRLFRVIDTDMRPVALPEEGLVMTDMLARKLDLRLGQMMQIEIMEGERWTLELPLVRTVREYAGMNAYMDIDALHRLMREQGSLSGGFLRVDRHQMPELYRQLKQTPRVASVSDKLAMVQSFDQTVRENQRQMQFFNMMFAVIIAAGVVYNTARISLSERSRELATLRVIGFTRGEISSILLGELAVLTLAALPLGMMLGYLFSAGVAAAFESESYRIPVVITRQTLGLAAAIVIAAAVASGLAVRRRLDHLDLVSVLKAKE
jgi:putative ABC transport system permease protein